jgi:hypothetical protein
MASDPEARYSRKFQKYLKDCGYYCVKYHGNRYAVKGTPDLLCCIEGRFIGIELKSKGNTPSPLQVEKGLEIQNAKGYWWSFDETVPPETALAKILSVIESEKC